MAPLSLMRALHAKAAQRQAILLSAHIAQVRASAPENLATLTTANRLWGKTAIVTGGGYGVGKAICRALADAGASVVVADGSEKRALAVAETIPRGTAARVDLTNCRAVKDLLHESSAALGGRQVDIFINNTAFPDCSGELHPPLMQTALQQMILRKAVHQMQRQGSASSGVVLNVTTNDFSSLSRLGAMLRSASTEALLQTKNSATECVQGVQVISRLHEMDDMEYGDGTTDEHSLRPLIDNVAQAAIFLCSDDKDRKPKRSILKPRSPDLVPALDDISPSPWRTFNAWSLS